MRYAVDLPVPPTESQRRTLASQLIDRARSDPAFRARLCSDPRGTLFEMGVDLPDQFELRVVEETPNVAYLVLPLESRSALDADLEWRIARRLSFCAWDAFESPDDDLAR